MAFEVTMKRTLKCIYKANSKYLLPVACNLLAVLTKTTKWKDEKFFDWKLNFSESDDITSNKAVSEKEGATTTRKYVN